tara:strand:- start:633 stop:1559 length:927 start_codon:yes stop_codon:yes gene_type:complete
MLLREQFVDFRVMELLEREKKFTTELIKNKFIELNVGNKNNKSHNYRIPFIIYRTWKNNDLTEQFIDAWNTTAINNPEFEQKLYTDLGVNNFINDFDYPGLKKAYNRINPKYGAARADLFRYAILYKNGGFYIDIKSYPKCSIKNILGNNDGILLSKWQGQFYKGDKNFFKDHSLSFSEKLGEWEQYWLACEKEHPIMKAILDRCIKNILEPQTNNLLQNQSAHIEAFHMIFITTGPLMMTYVIDNFIVNNPDFKDYTITKPSFDNCMIYSNGKNLHLGWRDHWTAYSKNNEKHYSQLSQSTEPLLIY